MRRVVEILQVRSVDVVADPATNNGLFESHNKGSIMKKKFKALLEACSGEVKRTMEGAMGAYPEMAEQEIEYEEPSGDDGIGAAFKMAMLKVLDDTTLDTAAKLAKLKAIMTVKDKAEEAMNSGMTEGDKSKMEESVKNLEAANLRESELTKQVATLKAELDKSNCRTLLIESSVEASEVRVKALMALQESERPDLVKTWKSGNVSTGKRPEKTGSVLQESANAGNYPASLDEFNRLLG